MKPLRLLFVTAEPHPTFRADVRVLFGKYLSRLGVQSDLLTQAAADGAATPWPAGLALLARRPNSVLLRLLAAWRNDLRLFVLAYRGYDAILVRDRVSAGLLGFIAARLAGIRFFYWVSYPKPESRLILARAKPFNVDPVRWMVNRLRGHLSSWLLYRFLLPRVDHIFVQSEAMRQDFVARGLIAGAMTAVPMGVDLDELALRVGPEPRWLALAEKHELIVYCGALDRVRQPEVMLAAMQLLRERRPNAHLLLIGGAMQGGDVDALRQRVEQLGLGRHVSFTGWVTPQQALGLSALGRVGLSVIPRGALYDVSSPTKVVEYFALGMPVVANDLPDQQLVLGDSGAGRCIQFNAEDMAQAIEALLVDPAQARDLGELGRRYVETHRSYSALAEQVASRLRQLMT